MPETQHQQKKKRSVQARNGKNKVRKDQVKEKSIKKDSFEERVAKEVARLTGKSTGVLAFEQKHGVSVPRNVALKNTHKRDLCLKLLDTKLPGSGSIQQRLMTLKPQEADDFKIFKTEAIHTIFGTQEPEVKLFSVWNQWFTTVGGVLSSDVIPIGFQYIQDVASWITLFDEVKMIKGEVTYAAVYYKNGNGVTYNPAVGAIDYDDATSTTFTNLSEYDTREYFYPLLFPGETNNFHHWPWHAQGQPGLGWNPTNGTATTCCWKTAILASMDASTTYGIYQFSAYVRFRQVI